MLDVVELPRQRRLSRGLSGELELLRSLSGDLLGKAAAIEHAVESGGADLFLAKAKAISHLYDDAARLEPTVSRFDLMMWVLFGMSGWWSANAVFAELPLFVTVLPAKESMGNQLALMTQLGNAFLLLYKMLDRHFRFNLWTMVHLMMFSAVVALSACALFWQSLWHGLSIWLLGLMIVSGGVGCMSNSTYWAIMISYPAVCTKAVGIGMSLGGVVVSNVVALQLGVPDGSGPLFSASFFFVMAAIVQSLLWLVAISRQLADKGAIDSEDAHEVALESSLLAAEVDSHRIASWTRRISALNTGSFFLYAATYTIPTLLPFVASGYDGMEQQLLLWMLLMQQVGETLGRIAAPVRKRWGWRQFGALASLVFVFTAFFVSALDPAMLASIMPCRVATFALPVMCFVYYFSFGVMQTAIFITARHLVHSAAEAERVASTMGFLGQMGSLSANLIASIIVNC